MEFEEVKALWESQGGDVSYSIDEAALYRRIEMRKRKAMRITHVSELLVICVYTAAGGFILFLHGLRNIYMDILAGWMFAVALLIGGVRMGRLMTGRHFYRTVRGELTHALAVASWQVRLSELMRWNSIVIAGLVSVALWGGGKPVWVIACTALFFGMGYLASGYEHRWYVKEREKIRKMGEELPGVG